MIKKNLVLLTLKNKKFFKISKKPPNKDIGENILKFSVIFSMPKNMEFLRKINFNLQTKLKNNKNLHSQNIQN
jgi:hypothetical protein